MILQCQKYKLLFVFCTGRWLYHVYSIIFFWSYHITAEDRIIYLRCTFEKGIITEKLQNILECFISHLKANWLCYAIRYVFKLNKVALSCRTDIKSKIDKNICDICKDLCENWEKNQRILKIGCHYQTPIYHWPFKPYIHS